RLALLAAGSVWLASAAAQETQDYSRLIFEPVPLVLTGDESSPPSADDVAPLPVDDRPAREWSAVLAEQASGSDAPAAPPEESIARYEESIRTLERQGGAYEARLAQELLGLGTAYQRLGDHVTAIATFERAWHVSRVNNGLFSLEQAPIVQRLIESQLATGDLIAADQQQEYLFFIQQKAYGAESPELLPALTALADWNIRAFNARLDGGYEIMPDYPNASIERADEGFLA